MRTQIDLSSWRLSLADGIVRLPARDPAMRPPEFEDRFDSLTAIYDVFWDAAYEKVTLLCPPLLSLEQDLELEIRALPSGEGCSFEKQPGLQFVRLVLAPPPGTTALAIGSPLGRVVLAIQPNLSQLFAERKVVYTLQKNNEIAWIRDWAQFYALEHGADAVILYDNGSDRYELEEVSRALSAVRGIEEVMVVDWSFPYGAFDLREDISFNVVDSIYCQIAAFDHVRWRAAASAQALVNADLDELVVRKTEQSLFEALEVTPSGSLEFYGYWVDNAREEGTEEPPRRRHCHYPYVTRPYPTACQSKWAVAPKRLHPAAILNIHKVVNAYSGWSVDFCLFHFKAISTMWDHDLVRHRPRDNAVVATEESHQKHPLLLEAFARSFLPEEAEERETPGATAAMRGHIARLQSGRAKAAGRTEEAVASARKAIEHCEAMQSYHEHLARLLCEGAEAEAARARAEELREESFGTHYVRGIKTFATDGPAAALPHFEKSMALDPSQTSPLVRWLRCLSLVGENARIAEMAEEVAGRNSAAQVLRPLLHAYRIERRHLEGVALIRRAVEQRPDDPILLTLMTEVLLQAGDTAGASQALARARALATREWIAADMAGACEDSTFLWESLTTGPDSGAFEWLEADIAVRRGEAALALPLMGQAAVKGYPRSREFIKLAGMAEEAGDPGVAHDARMTAIALLEFEALSQPTRELGELAFERWQEMRASALTELYLAEGQQEAALSLLEGEAARGLAIHKPLASGAKVLLGRAEVEEAAAWAERAVEMAPEDPSALEALANCRERQGKKEESLELLRAASARADEGREIDSALFHKLNEGQEYAEAAAVAREVLAGKPKMRLWWQRLVRALTDAEDLEAAVAALDEALGYFPGDQQFVLLKARHLNRLGRLDEAFETASKAVAERPDDPEAAEALAVVLGKLDRRGEAIELLIGLDKRVETLPASTLTVLARQLLSEKRTQAALHYAEKAVKRGGKPARSVVETAKARLARQNGKSRAAPPP